MWFFEGARDSVRKGDERPAGRRDPERADAGADVGINEAIEADFRDVRAEPS